jgi:hypothetical protein
MSPFETYQKYLSLKNHFTNKKYDYFKYRGKARATVTSFNARKDKYFFEKLSRQKRDEEIVDFFVSNFLAADNPSNVWIGEITRNGEDNYREWMRRRQSLSYLFTQESEGIFSEFKLDEIFKCDKGHPILLRKFMGGYISLETMVIYEKIFQYSKKWSKKLLDPAWETVSSKIQKYEPFLNIDIFQYKKLLRDIINE